MEKSLFKSGLVDWFLKTSKLQKNKVQIEDQEFKVNLLFFSHGKKFVQKCISRLIFENFTTWKSKGKIEDQEFKVNLVFFSHGKKFAQKWISRLVFENFTTWKNEGKIEDKNFRVSLDFSLIDESLFQSGLVHLSLTFKKHLMTNNLLERKPSF